MPDPPRSHGRDRHRDAGGRRRLQSVQSGHCGCQSCLRSTHVKLRGQPRDEDVVVGLRPRAARDETLAQCTMGMAVIMPRRPLWLRLGSRVLGLGLGVARSVGQRLHTWSRPPHAAAETIREALFPARAIDSSLNFCAVSLRGLTMMLPVVCRAQRSFQSALALVSATSRDTLWCNNH
jgi:hypothetical protein